MLHLVTLISECKPLARCALQELRTLYHTTARARSAISVSGNALSYNSSTGVITSAYEESPTFTGSIDVAGNITVGSNNTIFAENNIRFKATGASYIDIQAIDQDLIFRTSETTALDTNALRLDGSEGGNATFAGTISSGAISATGSANSGSASHLPAFLASGNYGGGIATRDTKESGWYQQTNGADWHFYHNRTVASDTPASKIVLSFNSAGNATVAGGITSSELTVSNSSAGDGANIADFRGSDTNQRLIIANFLCGSNEDRVGFIWENQGVALWRQWMDDAGNLRLKTSNPTSNT